MANGVESRVAKLEDLRPGDFGLMPVFGLLVKQKFLRQDYGSRPWKLEHRSVTNDTASAAQGAFNELCPLYEFRILGKERLQATYNPSKQILCVSSHTQDGKDITVLVSALPSEVLCCYKLNNNDLEDTAVMLDLTGQMKKELDRYLKFIGGFTKSCNKILQKLQNRGDDLQKLQQLLESCNTPVNSEGGYKARWEEIENALNDLRVRLPEGDNGDLAADIDTAVRNLQAVISYIGDALPKSPSDPKE